MIRDFIKGFFGLESRSARARCYRRCDSSEVILVSFQICVEHTSSAVAAKSPFCNACITAMFALMSGSWQKTRYSYSNTTTINNNEGLYSAFAHWCSCRRTLKIIVIMLAINVYFCVCICICRGKMNTTCSQRLNIGCFYNCYIATIIIHKTYVDNNCTERHDIMGEKLLKEKVRNIRNS